MNLQAPVNHANLTEYYGWLDRILEQVRSQAAADGRQITCKAGCAACCSEVLTVSKLEAQHIWDLLSEETKLAMEPKIRAWVSAMVVSGLGDFLSNQLDPIQYRRLGLVCPLLVDGLCSVYNDRPSNCRLHNASGPRERCENIDLRRSQVFVVVPELGKYGSLCLANLGHGAIETNHLIGWFGIFRGIITDVEVTASQVDPNDLWGPDKSKNA